MADQRQPTSEEAVCRMEDNALDTGTVPLIFVPGVMGSRIAFGGKTWDPDSNTNMFGWSQVEPEDKFEWLSIGQNGDGRVRTDSDTLSGVQRRHGWAGVSWRFYGQFIQDLQARSFGSYITPVWAVGYDWRQSNATSGRYLQDEVERILDYEGGVDRYILISHSMGGLVTRSFLKDTSAALRDKCLGIIHIAQPVNGGVVLVRRMFKGSNMSDDGGVGATSYVFSRILGTNRKDALTITAGMQGPLQLLVTDNYRDRDDEGRPIGWYDRKTFEHPELGFRGWPGNIWDLYQGTASPPGLLPAATEPYSPSTAARAEFEANLQGARDFHEDLGLWKYEGKTWSIYSNGKTVDTRVPFELPPEPSSARRVEAPVIGTFLYYECTRADGSTERWRNINPADRGVVVTQTAHSDGTVPAMSARGLFPGEHHRVRRGTDYDTHHQFEVNDPSHEHSAHDGICQHPQTETALFDIIEHLLGI